LLPLGGDYTISINNFPKGSTVTVHVMDGATDPFDLSAPLLTKFVNFDDSGPAQWMWSVSPDLKKGRYYLKASNTQGNIAYSPVIEVLHVASPIPTRHRVLM